MASEVQYKTLEPSWQEPCITWIRRLGKWTITFWVWELMNGVLTWAHTLISNRSRHRCTRLRDVGGKNSVLLFKAFFPRSVLCSVGDTNFRPNVSDSFWDWSPFGYSLRDNLGCDILRWNHNHPSFLSASKRYTMYQSCYTSPTHLFCFYLDF